MGWFTRKRPQALAPDELREALFEAVHAGGARRLQELVDAHRDTIREQFPCWQKVPESVRADPRRVKAYAAGLISSHAETSALFAPQMGQRFWMPCQQFSAYWQS
jgi:hypothetical protein